MHRACIELITHREMNVMEKIGEVILAVGLIWRNRVYLDIVAIWRDASCVNQTASAMLHWANNNILQ